MLHMSSRMILVVYVSTNQSGHICLHNLGNHVYFVLGLVTILSKVLIGNLTAVCGVLYAYPIG